MPTLEPKKISELDLATTLSGQEYYALVQGGITKKVRGNTIQQSFDQSCKCTLVSRYERIITDADTIAKYLQTYTVDSNTLVNNGERLEFKAFGTFASNTNTKKLTFFFGSTSYSTGFLTLTASVKTWEIDATIVRKTNTDQNLFIKVSVNETNVDEPNAFYPAVYFIEGIETLSTDIQIGIIGQNGTSNSGDISIEAFILDLHKLDPES